MKSFSHFLSILLTASLLLPAVGDTIVFLNGESSTGIVLRTNANDILVITDSGTVSWSRTKIKSINISPRSPLPGEQIPEFEAILLSLNTRPWASDFRQIPATVIDSGVMKSIPYVSFRCGDDYEVNMYGNLDQPVAVEAGVYRKLLESDAAKSNCINFISGLFPKTEMKQLIHNLRLGGDRSNHADLTFEITPSTEPDAYGGWWFSVYQPSKLDGARATDAEMREISSANDSGSSKDSGNWSKSDLKLARKIRPLTITFRNGFGTIITNAEITHVNEGVSLGWRDAYGSGVVKLADLPKDLQDVFDYDAEKAMSIEAAESAQRRQIGEQQRRFQAQLDAAAPVPAPIYRPAPTYADGGGYSGGGYTPSYRGGGGSVFVRGYTRKNGTYVSSYTRRR